MYRCFAFSADVVQEYHFTFPSPTLGHSEVAQGCAGKQVMC